MSSMQPLWVNGVARETAREPDRSLLLYLREELGLRGAKYACGAGECGACMVLVDGAARPACRTPLAEAAGHAVTTIEGLAAGGALHPVQRAFVEVGALQCGFCTPGMIMSAVAFLARKPDPTDAEIRAAMATNLCRCCAYPRIVEAIRRAAAAMRAPAGGRP
jgi:aerobic-type carbon monoxide dehydrogenase small subunit (CoxS/CutS family)